MTPPRGRLALWAYAALLRAITPFYLLRLMSRGRVEPLYRHALGERLGWHAQPAAGGAVWIHAVSLGETRAAAALVQALRQLQPHVRLLLTHGTATGRDAGRALLRDGDQQAWLPWDTPGATRRFLRHFRPSVGVLMETEVWPQLLATAEAEGLPMVLANARLSEKSRRRGERLAALLQPAAARLTCALAQTEADATRLRQSGVKAVDVTGNLKFDVVPDPVLVAQGRGWRQDAGRPVVLAASTREGEEGGLLQAWAAQAAGPTPRPLLLLVPRHPQRFNEVAGLIEAAGLTTQRRSSWTDAPPPEATAADVWLGDSMGEMPLYYGASDVALLGGSWAPLGGQNLIEAAACGCPVVMGPHTFNFAEAAELSLAAGAAHRAADIDDGVQQALHLLAAGDREAQRARALRFAESHQGAARRMAARILAVAVRASAAGSRP